MASTSGSLWSSAMCISSSSSTSMQQNADRSELGAKLRSNDISVALAACEAIRNGIINVSSKPTPITEDLLDASMICFCKFMDNEEIAASITTNTAFISSINKDYAQAVYACGALTNILQALKLYISNETVVIGSIKSMIQVCIANKKAWGLVRLQGGLYRVIEVLAEPKYIDNLKVMRHAFEFLALMSKRSISNCAVIAKMCGAPFIMTAATRHKDKTNLIGHIVDLLENLCLHAQVMRTLLDNDIVQWIVDCMQLYQSTATTFTALLKMLRIIVRHPIGAERFKHLGGLDVVLSFIRQHLTKIHVTKAASFLLWTMQLNELHDVSRLEPTYGFLTNFVPLVFNADKIPPQINHEQKEDDKASADQREVSTTFVAADANEDESTKQQSPSDCVDAKWDANQYVPELFDTSSPDVQLFLKMNAEELLRAAAQSVRPFQQIELPLMQKRNGRPGINADHIEPIYTPPPGLILGAMHAQLERYKRPEDFEFKVVYDRRQLDGALFEVEYVGGSSPRASFHPKLLVHNEKHGASIALGDHDDTSNKLHHTTVMDEAFDASDVEEEDDDAESRNQIFDGSLDCEGVQSEVDIPFSEFTITNSLSTSPSFFGDCKLKELSFESRFECGNLLRAIRVGDSEYDLLSASDLNSNSHTQWFYFRVQDMTAGIKYRFNFVNLEKPDSAFNKGMQPVIYSAKQHELTGMGWHRASSAVDIAYYTGIFPRHHVKQSKTRIDAEKISSNEALASEEKQYHRTLTLSITFPHTKDSVFLAYCYPFSYTFLLRTLDHLQQLPTAASSLRRQCLCYTRAGNLVPLLTITDFEASPDLIAARPVVILTARVHPGETNSSWIMKGLIEHLLGDSTESNFLRRSLVFKVIPMLNPDGVIEGNYRCALSGEDQNRVWCNPMPDSSPVIFHASRLIKHIANTRDLLLYCDFHGHSRIKNMCVYGCDELDAPTFLRPKAFMGDNPSNAPAWMRTTGPDFKGKERVFPALLARKSPNFFRLEDCRFSVKKDKEGSARVFLWKELGLHNCFTLEASFCGGGFGPLNNLHYNTDHYEEAGRDFLLAIRELVAPTQVEVEYAMEDASLSFANDATKAKRKVGRKKAGSKKMKKKQSK